MYAQYHVIEVGFTRSGRIAAVLDIDRPRGAGPHKVGTHRSNRIQDIPGVALDEYDLQLLASLHHQGRSSGVLDGDLVTDAHPAGIPPERLGSTRRPRGMRGQRSHVV